MYHPYFIDLDERYVSLEGKLVNIESKNPEKMVITTPIETLECDIPDTLKRSFEILPRKKGMIVIDREKNGSIKTIKLGILRFIDIHRHSEYSLLDGAIGIEDLVDHSDLISGISDHGVLFGALQFSLKAKAANKKAIIGFEGYLETIDGKKEGNHILLLIKNKKGYENACKLISLAEENFYRKPHISYDMLEKYHEGLICCSACLGGEIPTLLAEGDYDKALQVAETLQDIFGDDFYLEIQRHEIPDEKLVNTAILEIAEETGIKVVATSDSHYVHKEDAFAHEVLLLIGTKSKITDEKRFRFEGVNYHLLSPSEFEEMFADVPQAIENLYEIAEKCNFEFDLEHRYLPVFPVPAPYKSANEYFKHLCWEGFKNRFEGTPKFTSKEYHERLEFEISTIEKMQFEGYFLIVWDFIKFAKDNGIMVGPGRGSVVGSLVAYCLGITDLDPIPYELLFERFLNPERISMPDIDVDIEDTRREEVIEYVKRKYGAEQVSRIITFGTLSARAVVRDVARVLDKAYSFGDKISKAIPASPGMTIEKALSASLDLREMYEKDSEVKRIIDISRKLEGLARHKSQHACGIVIADKPINCFVPEVLLEDKHHKGQKTRTAAFNMKELEMLGLLKMDFLGLRNMSIIGQAQKFINNNLKPQKISSKDIPLNDPYVYKFIATGNTAGIFQIESGGMQSLMKQMFADVSSKISSFENKYKCRGFGDRCEYFGKEKDLEKVKSVKATFQNELETFGKELFERLIAAISLYRPGPMQHIPDYIKGMNDPKSIVYDTPKVEPILAKTYGVIVYQEQVQQIVRALAGYSLGRGDLIRRAMGKKDKKIMAAEKEIFLYGNEKIKKPDEALVVGCVNNGVPEDVAMKIWDKMETFAEYAFNKSHAAGYAVIAIQTAWLKTYYPVEFFTATLNSVIDKSDKLKFYLSEARKSGIKILGPDVNKSERTFKIEPEGIRIGLMGLRNLGKMAEPIIEERKKNGSFTSIEIFINRMLNHIDKKVLESLIYAGALDCFKGTRKSKIEAVPAILDFIKDMKKGIFDEMWFRLPIVDEAYANIKAISIPETEEEFDKKFKLEKEFKFAGIYISEHPLDEHMIKLEASKVIDISSLLPEENEEGEEIGFSNQYDGEYVRVAGIIKELTKGTTKKGDRYYHFILEDKTSDIKCILWPKNLEGNESKLAEGNVVIINGRFEASERGNQIIVNKITDLESIKEVNPSKIWIKINDFAKFAEIEKLINDNPGDIPVVVVYKGKKYSSKKRIDLNLSVQSYLRNYGKNVKLEY